MDINLAEFIAAHNITKLKADVMANPAVCPPCAARVEATLAKGITRETALADLQQTLDELVAEVEEKKKKDAKWKALAGGATETPEQKKAREAAEAEAAKKGKKAGDPEKKADDEPCKEGYHKDPDTGECVADNPKVTEEGLKALQDELASQRNMLMRLVQGQMSGEAMKSAKALKTSLGGMDDIPEEIRTKILAEVDRVYPTDVETMFNEFRTELLGIAKEKADRAIREVIEPVTEELETVRKRLKMPSREPRGTVDARGANALAAASNDHEALASLDRQLGKLKGGAS